ncbi:MAG: hypothetical protein PHQ35_04455 [Phycisphaerae bacterium]|nr:hypothetical protein [Phycisphaerae bacterium]MDD5380230.1 hypothetical protein [Phycisphaerae bacterium]
MNLIKKIRKNRNKVIAVVVIVVFVGFVGQQFFAELGRRRTNRRETIAHFADNREITNYDLALARQELEILKLLQADKLLRNINVPVFGSIDLHGVLLAELLFPDRTVSPTIIAYIRQTIVANRYRISEAQINDIYKHSMPNEIYWLLLKNEAHLAGIKASNEISGMQLVQVIPQLFEGASYPQIIGSITNRTGAPEEEILTAFSELTAILTYARTICSSEDITTSQIMCNVSWEEETIDVEFVKIDPALFAKNQKEPDEKEIIEQFDKYKSFFAGDVTDQNPYGFGYKLDDRVQLEYIAVKLDEVSAIITPPTEEDAEEFYQKHRVEFAVSTPSDPNDPNSTPVRRIRSYGEVAGIISRSLLQNKINTEAEKILQEARTLTEAGLQATDIEFEKITDEQLRQMAGDYAAAAEKLSEKYKIKVYTGKTGLLNVSDLLTDKYLGMLFLKGYGYNPLSLTRVVFAINELATGELGPFDIPKPRLYENIGPAMDMRTQIMTIMRATEAKKASEPESVNQTIAKGSIKFDEGQTPADANVYSVRKAVAEDLKKLSAMDTAKNKAEEFLRLAAKNGWESAVDKFNKLYGQQDKQDLKDANAFELQSFTNLQRASSVALETAILQSRGNPARQLLINKSKKEDLFINQLYSLVPQDSNTIDTLPMVVEFKPDVSYYCLKNISVKRLNQEQYDRVKALHDYKEDFIQSQSLAPVHLNPDNILKRLKFKLVEQDNGPVDSDTPSEPEGDF